MAWSFGAKSWAAIGAAALAGAVTAAALQPGMRAQDRARGAMEIAERISEGSGARGFSMEKGVWGSRGEFSLPGARGELRVLWEADHGPGQWGSKSTPFRAEGKIVGGGKEETAFRMEGDLLDGGAIRAKGKMADADWGPMLALGQAGIRLSGGSLEASADPKEGKLRLALEGAMATLGGPRPASAKIVRLEQASDIKASGSQTARVELSDLRGQGFSAKKAKASASQGVSSGKWSSGAEVSLEGLSVENGPAGLRGASAEMRLRAYGAEARALENLARSLGSGSGAEARDHALELAAEGLGIEAFGRIRAGGGESEIKAKAELEPAKAVGGVGLGRQLKASLEAKRSGADPLGLDLRAAKGLGASEAGEKAEAAWREAGRFSAEYRRGRLTVNGEDLRAEGLEIRQALAGWDMMLGIVSPAEAGALIGELEALLPAARELEREIREKMARRAAVEEKLAEALRRSW